MTDLDPAAILFDLDGTLRHSVPDGAAVLRSFAQAAGVQFSEVQVGSADRWTHYYFADSQELNQDRIRSGGDPDRFWLLYTRRYLHELGASRQELDPLAEQVNQRMREEYQPQDEVLEDVFPTLEQLQARGIKLGVVTNRSQPVDELMEALGMNGTFDVVLTAGEAGVWKPDPQIFRMAVQALGISPHKTVFVGDNYYSDIQGARRAGLHPVLYDQRGLFLDPECPVIHSIGELLSLIPFKEDGLEGSVEVT